MTSTCSRSIQSPHPDHPLSGHHVTTYLSLSPLGQVPDARDSPSAPEPAAKPGYFLPLPRLLANHGASACGPARRARPLLSVTVFAMAVASPHPNNNKPHIL